MILDDIPNDLIIDDIVAVNENVAEGDDLGVFGDLTGKIRIEFQQSAQGFADNFKLSFDGGAEQGIVSVMIKGFMASELEDQFRRLPYVFQPFLMFKRHRWFRDSG